MNWKLLGVLAGVAVTSTVLVKVIQSMSDRVDKTELAKDVASEAARSVKEQVSTDEY